MSRRGGAAEQQGDGSATLCHLTTPVQTVVTFFISQLHGWSRDRKGGWLIFKRPKTLLISPPQDEGLCFKVTTIVPLNKGEFNLLWLK